MTTIIDTATLAHQFDVAIDMLRNALRDCPDDLWAQPLWPDEPDQWVAKGFSKFWYIGYHTLFWLDLYLTGAEEGFAPPAPFALVEMHAHETLPRTYTRAELLGYLELCRQRLHTTLDALTVEQANRRCSFAWGELTFAELLLYTLRHIMEHSGHLGMFLGQQRK